MICPNCDSILNAVGCQSCGWKTGDPFPVHRIGDDSTHPLKQGGEYPIKRGVPKLVPVVKEPEPPVIAEAPKEAVAPPVTKEPKQKRSQTVQ